MSTRRSRPIRPGRAYPPRSWGISESSFDYPPTNERRCAFQSRIKYTSKGGTFFLDTVRSAFSASFVWRRRLPSLSPSSAPAIAGRILGVLRPAPSAVPAARLPFVPARARPPASCCSTTRWSPHPRRSLLLGPRMSSKNLRATSAFPCIRETTARRRRRGGANPIASAQMTLEACRPKICAPPQRSRAFVRRWHVADDEVAQILLLLRK
jgi:hypothetical protein